MRPQMRLLKEQETQVGATWVSCPLHLPLCIWSRDFLAPRQLGGETGPGVVPTHVHGLPRAVSCARCHCRLGAALVGTGGFKWPFPREGLRGTCLDWTEGARAGFAHTGPLGQLAVT